MQQGFVSSEALSQRESEARAAAADVRASEAALASARRSLDKSVVRAPFRAIVRERLANVAVVLVLGIGAYVSMPREQDPEINFNWISVVTPLPGASAEDVEKLVTEPLEDAIRKVSDIKFVSSNSREDISSILVRFTDISPAVLDKRINDLRREVQNKANQELPPEADDPDIMEITTSNGFPTAMILVLGQADDEVLRVAARQAKEDLERTPDVDTVFAAGLHDPELVVEFIPEALQARGLTAAVVARVVRLPVDGEVVASLQDRGEKVEVRVRVLPQALESIAGVLAQPVALPGGGHVALRELALDESGPGKGNIRHYNFRRTITLEADLDRETLDTVTANRMLQDEWEKARTRFPGVDLDFSGELDDIQESLDAMVLLLLFGVGLIYLIIGTPNTLSVDWST